LRSVTVHVEPSQFLAGWREQAGTVFLPTLSEGRVGDRVAVRVGIYGHPIRATLFGKIGLVRRVGRPALPPGVELHLERNSLAAAAFLAMAARGEPVRFQERSPRWSARRSLRLEHGGASFEATTVNVSDGGCAVLWPGQLPLVGDVVAVRLKEGLFAPRLRAIVCWNQPGAAAERMAGLKVIADGRGGRAWRALVAEVARESPPA
jgi:hypothetical protein